MQGLRETVGSLQETLNFDHGSSSSNGSIDPQVCWGNNIHNTGENLFPDYMLLPDDTNVTHVNHPIYNEHPDLNRWNHLDEPGSSSRSNPNPVVQNLNLNVGLMDHNNDDETSQVSPTTGSERLVEENNGRVGPVEGSYSSCKRKTRDEDVVGQSSSNAAECVGSSSLNPIGFGLTISDPSYQPNPSLRLGPRRTTSGSIPEPTITRPESSSSRSIRVRFNPPNQQDTINPTLVSSPSVPNGSSVLPVDHALDLSSAPPATDNVDPPVSRRVRRNVQPARWTPGYISRPGGSSSSNVHLSRTAISRQLTRARYVSASLSEHRLFMDGYDARNSFRSNTASRSLNNGSTSNPVNVASTSRVGSRVGSRVNAQPPPPPPTPTPSQSPDSGFVNERRFSELLRRSLLSSGSDGLPDSVSSMLSSGSDGQDQHQAQPSLGPRSDTERRNRYMVSEIRNMLDLMRRGESFHFEDASILDQSMFFGFGDIHDRHRDMRLDVDNMSYEELLALEERIGNVNTGLAEESIEKQLKYRKYSVDSESQHETEPCCICQEEYNDEDDLGKLECDHDFHSACIKQWLMRKNSCPICKTQGLSAKSEEK